jgi:excisionase family DNA binding protein
VIARGVFVPAEDCARVGRALLVAQVELRRQGLVDPRLAKLAEEALSVARSQPKVAPPAPAGARSDTADHFLPGRCLSVAEAASRMGVSSSYVRRLAATGRIPAVKKGSVWLVDERAVDEGSRGKGRGDRQDATGRASGAVHRGGNGREADEGADALLPRLQRQGA